MKNLNKFIGDTYDYSKFIFIKSTVAGIGICKLHGEFQITPNEHINKKIGCRICGKERTRLSKIKDTSYFINNFNKIYNNLYTYPTTIQGATNYFNAICKVHGYFTTTPNLHMKGYGCPMCNNKYYIEKNWDELKLILINKYPNNDYTSSIYINYHTLLNVTCKLHGEFQTIPVSHIKGSNCSLCKTKGFTTRLTLEEFIKRSKEIHNNYYDYSKVSYKSNNHLVIIICPVHGEFTQLPVNHLVGKGCLTCVQDKGYFKPRLTLEEFITRSKEKHNNYYSYEKTIYINLQHKVIVTCPIHGDFQQLAMNHIKRCWLF